MSLPLAIVLVLTPPTPPPPILPPPIERRLAPWSCPDIDPHFARYVPPPAGKGPIWPIETYEQRRAGQPFARGLEFGPAVKAGMPPMVPPRACPRLIPADRG